MLKLVVTDLDGTLWHGVAGEGEITPRGLVVRTLRRLADAGVLLATCTRNEPDSVSGPLSDLELPFLSHRFRCDDKAVSVAALADEANIDLLDVAFIDDDPLERYSVSHLPCVVLTPEEASALEPSTTVTSADRDRLQATRASIEFNRRLRVAENRDELLASLNFRISCAPAHLTDPRVRQLYERTSKLNATGVWPAGHVFAIHTESKIDPAGVNGAFSMLEDHIESLVLSCRLSGRGFPEAAIAMILTEANGRGLTGVHGEISPTVKNGEIHDLFERCGFIDGWFDLSQQIPAPKHWTIV